jgi:hypothetical protein
MAISRGLIIEPPAWMTTFINMLTERFAQRTGIAARQAP